MPKQGHGRELPAGFEEYTADGRPRCWSRAKGSGGQCRKWAMQGQNVCELHGGRAPQSIAKAKERIAEAKAKRLVAIYGCKIETTATAALLDEVQWTAGHVAWLRERVQQLEGDALVDEGNGQHPLIWGVTREKTGGEDYGITYEAEPNVWLKLYQAERTHLAKVCEAAIRAGIEERRVRLAESQGALVAEAIRAILKDLNLTDDQQARVSEVVPRHLRALASG